MTAEDLVGEFETHVTVECEGDGAVRRLERWAADRGVGFVHIVLARGRMTSQPMVTLRGTGALPEQRLAALAAADELRASGFEPVRVKIEAAPWTLGVPQSDVQAARLGPEVHFEHHIKVLVPPDFDHAAMAALVSGHGAHVSWNARRVMDDGRQQRFVTQRCYGVGLHAAGERLERLVGAVSGAGYEIASVEREFVVYDSNISVDDGWIGEGPQT
ncbi:hypothetical protein VM95_24195 [Streptomyces rubellomurinus]|uniref:Ankyrin n=1 Tax=Streptomyces rubellomurinus (strain ATCC 31215) TaxID=359131 RepID=A0A0F2T9U0_STRR3|nr:hypothetical protein VM95_24195 [Streptomyces rubellomurinus]